MKPRLTYCGPTRVTSAGNLGSPSGTLLSAALSLAFVVGCGGGVSASDKDGGGGDSGSGLGIPDRPLARRNYKSLTDLQRRVTSTSCAAQDNNCHWNDAYPQLTSEANMISLTKMRCNVWRADGKTWDDFCEPAGDQLRVGMLGMAANDAGAIGVVTGMTLTVGYIEAVRMDPMMAQSPIIAYDLVVKESVTPLVDAGMTPSAFSLTHAGQAVAWHTRGMGAGTVAGKTDRIRVAAAQLNMDAIGQIVPGDPNANGTFGDGSGYVIKPGDAENSYLTIRLLGPGLDGRSKHPRMPLEPVAMSPVTVSPYLGPTEMYAIKSWINCMTATDVATTPINFDCAANTANNTTP